MKLPRMTSAERTGLVVLGLAIIVAFGVMIVGHGRSAAGAESVGGKVENMVVDSLKSESDSVHAKNRRVKSKVKAPAADVRQRNPLSEPF